MTSKRWLVPLYAVAALALSALTCWALGINPLPHTENWSRDPGWFLTFAAVYFFALLIGVERLMRGRRK